MLLALDVGNTNITLGVYEGEKLLFVTRMATNPPARCAVFGRWNRSSSARSLCRS